MSYIATPRPNHKQINSINDFWEILREWQDKYDPSDAAKGFVGQLWYRGVNQWFEDQRPGVYRGDFTARATRLRINSPDIERRRLHLEREMLSEFRTTGASF